jgi:hypothetical protein
MQKVVDNNGYVNFYITKLKNKEKWKKKIDNLSDENFVEVMEKLISKYKKNPNYRMYLHYIFDSAMDYGCDSDLFGEESFFQAVDKFYRGYYFSVLIGQGSSLSIYDKNRNCLIGDL